MARAVSRVLTLAALLAFGCGPKTFNQRLNASEKLATEADEEMSRAEKAMQELEPERARRFLDDAKKVLAHPDANLYPEYEMMNDRLKADVARLPAVEKAREKRDVDLKVAERKKDIADAVQRYQKAFDRLVAKDLSRADLDAFDRAARELGDRVKPDELEKKSETWAAEVKDHRELIERGTARTGTARARVGFLEGPGAASVAAKQLAGQVRKEKALDDKVARQTELVAKLDECAKGKQLIDRSNALTMNTVWLENREVAPTAVVKGCTKDLEAARKALGTLKQAQATARAAAAKKEAQAKAAAAKRKK